MANQPLARRFGRKRPSMGCCPWPTAVAFGLPVGFGPWLLVLRNRRDLLADGGAERGWSLLLDPSLRKQVVLPASAAWWRRLPGASAIRLKAWPVCVSKPWLWIATRSPCCCMAMPRRRYCQAVR